MLARCARCQGTFTTDRFGLQTCPHCGSELMLSDPNAPAPPAPPEAAPAAPPAPPAGAPAPSAGPAWGAPPPPPPSSGAGPGAPPPPGAPPGGYGPPPGGYGPPPGGWPAPPGGGVPAPGPELPAPFAERASRGFFQAFFETWKLVAVQPQHFFGRVRIDQTGSAVLFAVIAYTFGALVQSLYSWLSGRQGLAALGPMLEHVPPEQAELFRTWMQGMSGSMLLGQVILAPLFAVVGVYVTAGIVHLLLMLFRGANRGFDATLTAAAYAVGLNVLLAIPGCGAIIALVWYVVVLIIGLGASQRCGPGKAAAAVLTPALLACACCCGALGIGMGGMLKAFRAGNGATSV